MINTKYRPFRGRKVLPVLVFAGLAAFLSAQTPPSAHDTGMKLGVELGYPTAVTFGWRMDKDFELGILAGSRYEHFDLGVNGLFRLASIEIEKEPFPVSLGPELILGLGDAYVGLDALTIVRIENTLRTLPLNFFLEAGLGLKILPVTTFTGSGVLGIRFVFDHPALKILK